MNTRSLFHRAACRLFAGAVIILTIGFWGTAQAAAVTPMVAGGGSDFHTVALKNDGTVMTWGRNSEGQLGDGTTITRSSPMAVAGLSSVVAVAASRDHTVALKADGTVMTWGSNANGQLGDGTTDSSLRPLAVPGLSGVVAIAAGTTHTVVLKADGTLMAWGNNGLGVLGDGTNASTHTPLAVPGLSGVVAIAAGSVHTLALEADGTVMIWGHNGVGQLGDGTVSFGRNSPVAVPGLSGVVAVSAGSNHTVALKADGTIMTWGYNASGQIGDGTTYNSLSPLVVPGLSGVVAVAGGGVHTAALKADGTLMTWGNNFFGQLGDGTTTDRLSPLAVPGLSGVVAIAAGVNHTIALKADGTIMTWGWNKEGQLGDGTNTNRYSPVLVPGLNLGPSSAILTVSKNGSGTGTVSSSPNGISCGAACSAAFTIGANVTLTATPTVGHTFTGWGGACTGTGSCVVAMSAAQSVTATFALTPIPKPVCSLSVSGTSVVLGSSSTMSVTCNPAATSFVWTGGTCAGTTAASCKVTPTATTTYSVAGVNAGGTGTAVSTTIKVVASPTPVCTVSATPNSVTSGGYTTLMASCSPIATTYKWTGGNCSTNLWSPSCTTAPTATTTYTVAGVNAVGAGTPASATVTVQAVPKPSCTVTATPATVTAGGYTTLVATCNPYATSYVWTGGSCGTTTWSSCTTVPSDTTTYTVAGVGAGGTGTPASATVTVQAVPKPVCTVTATPSTVSAGGYTTLVATCNPYATSYVWTGGTCGPNSWSSCTTAPLATTTYTVSGVGAGGTGTPASATVTVESSATYLFRDDFDGTALKAQYWTEDRNFAGTVDVANNQLSTGCGASVMTKGKYVFSGTKIIVEGKFMATGAMHDSVMAVVDTTTGHRIQIGETNYAGYGFYVYPSGVFSNAAADPARLDGFRSSGVVTTASKEYRMTIDGTAVTIERGDTLAAITETLTTTLATSIAGKEFYLLVGTGGPDYCPGSFDYVQLKATP